MCLFFFCSLLIIIDEMGLGKTIQTIALLAWLACEHDNVRFIFVFLQKTKFFISKKKKNCFIKTNIVHLLNSLWIVGPAFDCCADVCDVELGDGV